MKSSGPGPKPARPPAGANLSTLPQAAIRAPQTARTAAVAIVALGSNCGDSPTLVHAAMDRLAAFSLTPPRRSSLWRSAPVDCPPGSPWFVNAVVALTPLPGETPESLLDKLLALERAFGRRPKRVLNEPRPLDLDLIVFGAERRATPRLTLPHPRAAERRFVLAPLAEIAPDLQPPGWPAPVRRLLEQLPAGEVVERLVPA